MMPQINERFNTFWYYGRKRNGKWENVKAIVKLIFFEQYFFEKPSDKINTFFFICHPRKDYLKFFTSVQDCCEAKNHMLVGRTNKKFSLTALKYVFRYGKLFSDLCSISIPDTNAKEPLTSTTAIHLSLIERINLFAHYVCIGKFVEQIVKDNFYGAKKVVVMADAWMEESLLIEEAKKKGIYTICCQHGLFLDKPNEETTDKVNYYHLPADKYLLWGEKTKALFQKYNPDVNVSICGNISVDVNSNTCQDETIWCVLLDQPIYHKYNQRMISIVEEIAQKQQKKVILRIHPLEKGMEDTYRINSLVTAFDDDSDRAGIIFGHTSTMVLIYLLKGYPVYKFKSDIISNFNDEILSFSDEEELELKMKKNENINFAAFAYPFFTYYGEEAKKQYRKNL